jgi:hypothetical protein
MTMLRAEILGGERLRHDAAIGEPPELMAAVDVGGDLESVDPGRAEVAEDLHRRARRQGLAGGLEVDVTPSKVRERRAEARDRAGP